MSAIEDREKTMVIDLSRAVSSADALKLLEKTLGNATQKPDPGLLLEINTGELLLTPGVLNKMKTVTERYGVDIETLYSSVPQTQQSALDEGLFVRQKPPKTEKFDPEAFVAQAYKDLDLPFETIKPKAAEIKATLTLPQEAIEKLPQHAPRKSKLSVAWDDGTVQELQSTNASTMETVYYPQTLRSGQVLEAQGNIVIVGDAHSGSEIYADGDILIWGTLGGIAHAGRHQNLNAEIRAIRIEAVQLRIADLIARRPDRLFKPGQNQRRAPEVAKVIQGEIQIYEDIFER